MAAKAKSAVPKKIGRPSSYTDDMAEKICNQLAQGETLRAICRKPGMPPMQTILRWLNASEAFRGQYMRAREAQADYWADQIIDISDLSDDDENVNRSRLRVDTRKWLMARMAPKKYGDKTTAELTGTIVHSLADLVNQSYEPPKVVEGREVEDD